MSKRLLAVLTALLILFTAIWLPFQHVYAESGETQIQEILEDAESPAQEVADDLFDGGPEESEPEPDATQENPLQLGDLETDEGEDPLDADVEEPEQTGDSPNTEDDEQIIQVYAVMLDSPDDAYFLEAGGNVGTIPLETIAWAQYDRFEMEPCKIVWRYDEFDNMTPGRRMIVGDIELPPGYAFNDEPMTVESPVIVYGPDGAPTEKVTTCLYTWTDKPILIPLGAELETLAGYFTGLYSEAYLITENGDTFSCPFTLDLDVIDTGKEGVYYPVIMDLPGGVTFGGQEFYLTGVHVVRDDEVDLRTVKWWRSGYNISWLYLASAPVLWAAVDDEDWYMPDTWADGEYNTYGCFNAVDEDCFNELILTYNNLPTGHIYKFQVQYDGDKFSNVLELDLINNSLPKSYFDHGGDRTGGDRGENSLPPITPPTPPTNSDDETLTPPQANSGDGTPTTPPVTAGTTGGTPENNEDNAVVLPVTAPQTTDASETPEPTHAAPSSARPAEYSDETSVTISGERLALMIAVNNEYVSFIRGELCASLPVAYLESLDLDVSDAFTVILYQPDDQSFNIAFAVNDNPLTDPFFDPFLVSLTWQSGPVSCTSQSGESADAILDGGRATFPLHMTGTYAIMEQVVTAAAIPHNTDASPNDSTAPANNMPLDNTTEENAKARPYADDFVPVAVLGSISLACALVFLGITKKRRVTRL